MTTVLPSPFLSACAPAQEPAATIAADVASPVSEATSNAAVIAPPIPSPQITAAALSASFDQAIAQLHQIAGDMRASPRVMDAMLVRLEDDIFDAVIDINRIIASEARAAPTYSRQAL